MNLKAYKQGWEACDKYILNDIISENPYKKSTKNWLSWNRGWNDSYDGAEKTKEKV